MYFELSTFTISDRAVAVLKEVKGVALDSVNTVIKKENGEEIPYSSINLVHMRLEIESKAFGASDYLPRHRYGCELNIVCLADEFENICDDLHKYAISQLSNSIWER